MKKNDCERCTGIWGMTSCRCFRKTYPGLLKLRKERFELILFMAYIFAVFAVFYLILYFFV